jgi:hypothetical protein
MLTQACSSSSSDDREQQQQDSTEDDEMLVQCCMCDVEASTQSKHKSMDFVEDQPGVS